MNERMNERMNACIMNNGSKTKTVEYRTDAERGRHLVATRRLLPRERIFVERPLVALQSLDNVHCTLVCRHCRGFCRDVDDDVTTTCTRDSPPCSRTSIENGTTTTTTATSFSSTTNNNNNNNNSTGSTTSMKLAAGSMQRSQVCDEESQVRTGTWNGTRLVPCRQGCGEVYCSVECRDDHWQSAGHCFLCTGAIADQPNENDGPLHPLVQFKMHAVQTNEIFLAVADVLAWILAEYMSMETKQRNCDKNHNDPSSKSSNNSSNTPTIHHASADDLLRPYWDFLCNPWWHVATAPLYKSPMGFANNPVELDATLRRLCDESSGYLCQAWTEHDYDAVIAKGGWTGIVKQLCTPLMFAKIIGSFEQNAIGIRQRNPLCRKVFDKEWRHANRRDIMLCLERAGMIGQEKNEEEDGSANEEAKVMLPSSDDKIDVSNEWDYTNDEIATFLAGLDMNEYSSGAEEGDDLDLLFPPLDGTAMYHMICKMNHSCDPNVVVLYPPILERGVPLVAQCVALREIQAGEELCISYIESGEALAVRREALANYGFECNCRKCILQGGLSVAQSVETEQREEMEDLFGVGTDDDDSDEPVESYPPTTDDNEVDGEKLLQKRLMELNVAMNENCAGAIPTQMSASARTFVVQVGSAVLTEIIADDSESYALLLRCIKSVRDSNFSECRQAGQSLEQHLFTILESNGTWSHAAHREAYWCSAVSSALYDVHVGNFLHAQILLDKAMILGLPRHKVRDFCDYVEMASSQAANGLCRPAVDTSLANVEMDAGVSADQKGLSRPMRHPVLECPSSLGSDEFRSKFLAKGESIVIRNMASGWPALSKWCDLNELTLQYGHRLVPVELGSMMNRGSSSEGMKERLMSFRSFISCHLVPGSQRALWSLQDATTSPVSDGVAYLAQHPLLDQFTGLAKDVVESPALVGGPCLHRNVWIGTGGTRTPLHFDSYNNLLVQIVGYKYVRVYDASQTKYLYVIRSGARMNGHSYTSQNNMSAVDCEMEDYKTHPLTRQAKYLEVLLLPGDALFLPSGMWHYVRSLSTSISVNYWW